jgi:hypothetical protein
LIEPGAGLGERFVYVGKTVDDEEEARGVWEPELRIEASVFIDLD